MQFRKKPVVIEAEQFLPDTSPLPFSGRGDPMCFSDGKWTIYTLEGPLHATSGDWIIRGVKGEFYPCKPGIFAATYEEVSEPCADADSVATVPFSCHSPRLVLRGAKRMLGVVFAGGQGPVTCMICGKPAVDASDYDRKGVDGCCEDAEWGYCRECNTWSERAANWGDSPGA